MKITFSSWDIHFSVTTNLWFVGFLLVNRSTALFWAQLPPFPLWGWGRWLSSKVAGGREAKELKSKNKLKLVTKHANKKFRVKRKNWNYGFICCFSISKKANTKTFLKTYFFKSITFLISLKMMTISKKNVIIKKNGDMAEW